MTNRFGQRNPNITKIIATHHRLLTNVSHLLASSFTSVKQYNLFTDGFRDDDEPNH